MKRLMRFSGGDARKLYNALELVVTSEADESTSEKIVINNEKVLKPCSEESCPLRQKW